MPREVIDVRDSENDLKQLVTDILAEAARQGASAAEVSVNDDVGLGVTVRKGELETVEFNQDRLWHHRVLRFAQRLCQHFR